MENMVQPELRSNLPDWAIPARIVIGVTGHRKLDNYPALADAIRSAIDSIKQMVPPLKHTPLLFYVLSPLAEGGDRLVAREVLKVPEAMLEVVLPVKKDDYMTDFKTDESRKEFESLLSQAKNVRILPSRGNRVEAYEQVGHYIVDQCDVLIALWDGKLSAGRGGTQEIVQYTRENHCPLVWIHTDNPAQIEFEMARGIDTKPFHDLDEYNSERTNPHKFKTQLSRDTNYFNSQAEKAKLSSNRFRSFVEYIWVHYVRGDILALNYQHLYYRAETLIYALALAAIVIAAFQILFVPDRPVILISEIGFMLAALTIVWVSHRQRWHDKWIDYRFLAERFRSALVMAVANVEVTVLRPLRHLSLAYSPKDWMVVAFTSVWSQRPQLQMSDSSLFEGVKHFLCEAWIEDQIRYHDGTGKRHYRRYQRMAIASYVLFGLTIVVALLHVLNFGSHLLETTFAFMAIIFPAIAASITAIRTHRDYLRNSMRSAEMVGHLKELKEKMVRVQNLDGFLTLVKEAEETMLHENEDWRVVVRFHKTEPV
ncbi:MAG: SLATT domain-containing protein [Dehalococcoidales bacterium]|nr:SLATT domain-containing protein [Dehalococcoidales bacterium]